MLSRWAAETVRKSGWSSLWTAVTERSWVSGDNSSDEYPGTVSEADLNLFFKKIRHETLTLTIPLPGISHFHCFHGGGAVEK